MPGRDGTGPFGRGAGTGGGRGWCRNLLAGSGRRGLSGRGLFGAFVPLVGIVVRDVLNPNGFLRSLGSRISSKNTVKRNNRIDADVRVIDDNETENRI